MYVHTDVVCMDVAMHVCMRAWNNLCMYGCMCVYVRVYVCMYARMNQCMHDMWMSACM